MQHCPACDAENANRNVFCWACGEVVRVDRGFEKKVRRVMAEDRKNGRGKKFTARTVLLGVLGFLGYETVNRMVTAAVEKVKPVVQAQVESDVQKSLKADLPAIASQASHEVATRVRQEIENGFVQAARQEAEKVKPDFRTHLAAIQAQEDTKLRAAYQQAQTNIQTAASIPTSWVGTTVTPTTPFNGLPLTLGGLETPTHSPSDDIVKWANGTSTTLTLSVTSTPFQSNSITSSGFQNSLSGTICFTDKGKMGSFDSNGACKEYTTVPVSNLITQ